MTEFMCLVTGDNAYQLVALVSRFSSVCGFGIWYVPCLGPTSSKRLYMQHK